MEKIINNIDILVPLFFCCDFYNKIVTMKTKN
jgi:hypothetical protein